MRTPNRFQRRQAEPENRINEFIVAPQVRLIKEDGEPGGVVELADALALAEEAGVDLVEMAAAADPPVCRLMDYKKHLYEKQRKKKEARKHQRHVETKEVKLRPNIDEHDYQTKLSRLRKFLTKGYKCKISLQFRQREMRRYEIGQQLVERMLKDVSDIAVREPNARQVSRMIIRLVSPTKELIAAAEKAHKEEVEKKRLAHEERLARKHRKVAPEVKEESESSSEG